MTVHREGNSTIALAIILGLAVITPICVYTGKSWPSFLATSIFIIAFLFIIRFFRYPNRNFKANPGIILSPADGKIIAIEKEIETEYYNEERLRVSVFMSGFNVHANWVPVSGTIQYNKYHPGRNLFAIHPKSSLLNERTSIVILNENGKETLIRQIAGIFARRVVTYPKSGQVVNQGEELGFIKFGSRLDIFLPCDTKVLVKIGDKVKGNLTELAVW